MERPDTRTLLVEDTDGLAGYSMLRTADTPLDEIDPSGLLLQRFYLHQRLHGSGVADELLAETSKIATEFGAPTIWLTVWEHNPRAIRFYEKRGFKTLGTCEFMLGKDQQTDVVMALSLVA